MATERPRDRLGRPLPWNDEGFPGVVPRDSISSAAAIAEAERYLLSGLPFHAHEVLEMRWRCCPSAERPLWQGLAQAAASATHTARGNAEGASRLAERARSTLSDFKGSLSTDARALIDMLLN
jgi:uncharacterized protein